MSERTVGQEQDDAAFEEVLASWYRSMNLHPPGSTGLPPPRDKWHHERLARLAFDAGMREQRSRGCCQEERDG
jgi:hypothetical protein